MCIDIVKIAKGLLMGKFRPLLTVICLRHDNGGILSFHILFVNMYPPPTTTTKSGEGLRICLAIDDSRLLLIINLDFIFGELELAFSFFFQAAITLKVIIITTAADDFFFFAK